MPRPSDDATTDGAEAESGEAETEGAETDVRLFAVVNASELVERLAYYGVISIVALYLSANGYSSVAIGALFAVLLPLPYVVPMLAGPLAAKLGYKPVMLAAFVAYAAGFLLLATSPAVATVLCGIVLVGVGAGLFKPLTAASIGLVTAPRHRSLGYSIYYVGINVGGFVGPLLIAALGGSYRLAFLMGATAIGADFLLVLLLFRNPVPAQRGLSVAASFRPLLEVLRNGRFLALLAIFAGFWMVYSMNFTFVILYLQRYVDLPSWFRPSFQVSLESLCVIVLGVPLGALATRMPSTRTMVIGIALLVAGFALVGLFPVFPAFVAGILLVAAGEVLAYPGFLAYVSTIAPRDRVAVYQGYGFLPLFAGFLLGPLLGGALYGSVVQEQARPALFWTLMCSVGLLTLAALVVYAGRAPGARAKESPRRAVVVAIVPILLAFALVAAGYAAGERIELPPRGAAAVTDDELAAGTVLGTFQGTTAEGEESRQLVQVPAGAGNVTFVLEWSDEAPASPLPGAANQADSFRLEVRPPSGSPVAQSDSTGEIRLTLGAVGAIEVLIQLQSAGDTTFAGQTVAADTGNDWTLTAVVA